MSTISPTPLKKKSLSFPLFLLHLKISPQLWMLLRQQLESFRMHLLALRLLLKIWRRQSLGSQQQLMVLMPKWTVCITKLTDLPELWTRLLGASAWRWKNLGTLLILLTFPNGPLLSILRLKRLVPSDGVQTELRNMYIKRSLDYPITCWGIACQPGYFMYNRVSLCMQTFIK